MEQTEIKLPILYFLVAVIVTCETRFRQLGQTENTGGGYGNGPISSNSQRLQTYNKRYPKNIPINGGPFGGLYLPGRYTKQLPVNTERLISNRGLQPEISPYLSNQVSPGRYISTDPPRFTQTVSNDGGSVLHEKSLFVRPGQGYANPKITEKFHIEPRYPLYDGSQVLHPYDDQDGINVYNRAPYHNKFKKPYSGQPNANIHPAPYGGTSKWSINRHAPNNGESLPYKGYQGVRSFNDIPTFHEGGDLTAQDDFALYSIPNGDPTG